MRPSSNHAFVNQVLVYTLFTICLSGSIGLGTVWLRHQISLTANASRLLESRLAELSRRLNETSAAVESRQDRALLKQLNLDLGLGFVPPTPAQIQNVTEDPATYLAAKRNLGLFGDRAAVVHFDAAAPATTHVDALAARAPAVNSTAPTSLSRLRLASKN